MAPSQNSITPADRTAAVKAVNDGTMTVDEAASHYKVTAGTIKNWMKDTRYAGGAPAASTATGGASAANAAGAGGRGVSLAERYVQNSGVLGQVIKVQSMVGRALLIAATRLAIAAVIALITWYLLEVDGDQLEERRRRWVDLANKLAALKDGVSSAIAPLKPEGAWNTSDKDAFMRYMDGYLAEIEQLSAAANSNAGVIDNLLKAVTVLFGWVLAILSILVIIIFAVAPALFTPAAPAAKTQIEILGLKISLTVTTMVSSVLTLAGTLGPILAFQLSKRSFVGDQPNARGAEGTTFESIKIDWKVTKTH